MNSIVIFSARIARDLIKNKFMVVDIKPNKNDRKSTVFYFGCSDEIKDHLKTVHNIIVS